MRLEAGKPLASAAFETDGAIALAIGNRRYHSISDIIRSGASVNGRRTALLHIRRKAKRADHVAIAPALLVDIANVAVARGAGVTELEADAVAVFDIAFAIRHQVVSETAGRGAQGIALIPANRERRLGVGRRKWVETEC